MADKDKKSVAAVDGATLANGADRNVDQIRDILFGGQMRDYERRFQDFHQKLEADLQRLQETQAQRISQLEQRFDEQLDKLGKQLRQEVQDRTRSTDDLETRVQQAARSARDEINTAIDHLSKDLAGTDERLRRALDEVSQNLARQSSEAEAALGRAGARLQSDKVGRQDMAALLTELALRLNGEFDLPTPNH